MSNEDTNNDKKTTNVCYYKKIMPYYIPLKNQNSLQFTVHTWTYVAVVHCVCLAACEMGRECGLTLIVIVIVIMSHFVPLFLYTKWHPIFCLFLYNYR